MKTRLLLLFVLFNGLLYAQYPITNLIGAYDFNGDLTDQANGVNMTANGLILYPPDRFGTPTSSARLIFGDASRINVDFPNNNNIQYNFWIKTTIDDANRRTIIEDSDRTDDTDSDYDGYFVYLENGAIGVRATLRFGTTLIPFANIHPTAISDGEWHNINVHIDYYYDFTYNDTYGVISIKVDGVEDVVNPRVNNNSTSVTTSYNSIDGNVALGNNRAGDMPVANKYVGEIDNLLIYSLALSQAQVESIIDYGNYCQKPDASLVSITSITNDGGTVNINDSGTYDIAYHVQGEPFSSATIVNNVTTSHVITGLEANLDYDVYIREICAVTTSWSEVVSFKTDRPTGTVYVNPAATGLNTGTSWANAYTDLQSALDNSRINESVWLVGGTYKPTVANGDRTIAFTINSRINVLGGFAGTEAAATERVYGANQTILSGDLNEDDDANIDPLNALRAENSYRVLVTNSIVNSVNVGIILDRLTITGGNANGTGVYNRGGAITKGAITRAITIKDCNIENNSGLNRVVDMRVGGGQAGNITITRSKFRNNYSRGGALYCFSQATTTVNVLNSLFENNIAADISGAGQAGSSIWLKSDVSRSVKLDVRNSTFVDNQDLGTDTGYNNFNRATIVLERSISAGGTPSTTDADVYNSIFYNNTTIGGNTAKLISGGITTIPGTDVFNSIDENGFSQLDPARVINSTNSNPMFNNASMGDYTLTSSSPAVDSGDNTYVTGTEDLDGNIRIFNAAVDMGAYEYGSTLGVSTFQLNENEIKLYPNPTSSVLNIKMKNNLKQATVYSLLGAKVLETKSSTINTSNLNTGMYLITIEDENGSVATKRFIKQ
ncbi:T9SS type A sorting domain-containing protein [Lacinutrix sp. MEBiC02404]